VNKPLGARACTWTHSTCNGSRRCCRDDNITRCVSATDCYPRSSQSLDCCEVIAAHPSRRPHSSHLLGGASAVGRPCIGYTRRHRCRLESATEVSRFVTRVYHVSLDTLMMTMPNRLKRLRPTFFVICNRSDIVKCF